jgi:hypothetical protein
MEQYKSLSDRYEQLTDKYVNLKLKYRESSKNMPWSHDSDTYSQRYKSPSPAPSSRAPSSYVRSTESLMMKAAREYRTPPREQETRLSSEDIIRRHKTPLMERQVDVETPRYRSPSIIDRELDIFVPRYETRHIFSHYGNSKCIEQNYFLRNMFWKPIEAKYTAFLDTDEKVKNQCSRERYL